MLVSRRYRTQKLDNTQRVQEKFSVGFCRICIVVISLVCALM